MPQAADWDEEKGITTVSSLPVFQFPEYQLFEENVEKDVAFGPMNFGLKEEEALKKAHEALEKVGLNESFFKRSPFELSGGEKRRVAIAGILAIEPKLLIIDEPTAGLDPVGAAQVMELFKKIHEDDGSAVRGRCAALGAYSRPLLRPHAHLRLAPR